MKPLRAGRPVFAWTAPRWPFPPFISVNEHDNGKIFVMVRGEAKIDIAAAELPADQLDKMIASLIELRDKRKAKA